jgi:glycosyltransferase involved in cell wall biosynthesis
MKKAKIIVVMPAYNAATTLEKTYRDINKKIITETILVDDASTDDTVKRAKKLGLCVYSHKKNKGYGGNQKTCYTEALKRKPDYIVMIHPDYQYDSTKISEMIKPLIENEYDIMLGSRIRTRNEALAGGMPLYKYISNRALTLIENIILGLNLSEYHTGLRAYKVSVLNTLPWKKFSDDFVFDSQFLVSAIYSKFRIGEIPVPVRYFPEASSINFIRSAQYGLSTIQTLVVKLGIYTSSVFKR